MSYTDSTLRPKGEFEGNPPPGPWSGLPSALLWIVGASGVAALGAGTVTRLAGRVDWAERGDVWFLAGEWRLTACLAPIVVAAFAVAIIQPGWFLARAFGVRQPARRVAVAIGLSLLLLSPVVALVERVSGASMTGPAFVGFIAALAALCAAGAVRFGKHRAARDLEPGRTADLLWIVIPPLVLMAALFPKALWEAFNGDGAHAFEVTRLAVRRLMPFFDPAAGAVAAFPTDSSFLFAWPASWFMRCFGEIDAAPRFPFFVYLALIAAALFEFAPGTPVTQPRRWSIAARLGVWLGLAAFVQTMAFNATYSPYSTDLACPAAQDLLLLGCFAAFVSAWTRGAAGSAALFALLAQFSVPSGRLLVLIFAMAAVFLVRPLSRRCLSATALALALGVLFSRYGSDVLMALGQAPFGQEYDTLVSRFRMLVVTDWRRLAFLILPCGIVPVWSLFTWRKADGAARAVIVVCAVYFVAFYVQQAVALHHFAPCMLLPLLVHWRRLREAERPTIPVAVTIVGALVALVIAWPAHVGPFTAAREIGAKVVDVRGHHARHDPRTFTGAELLESLFPAESDPRVPDATYGGSALVWLRYARQDTEVGTAAYVLSDPSFAAPDGFTRAFEGADAVLWVGDPSVLESDRARRPDHPVSSPLLTIPRHRLFPGPPRPGDPTVIDLKSLLERLGLRR